MRVNIIRDMVVSDGGFARQFRAGTSVDVRPDTARRLARSGAGVIAEETAPEPETITPAPAEAGTDTGADTAAAAAVLGPAAIPEPAGNEPPHGAPEGQQAASEGQQAASGKRKAGRPPKAAS